ncbi:molybdopterin dinucleotide binding domain-containing protein [Gemmatimonas sp.]|uniref:molybdopterin dinucleotide binding domain-containing protein n=1 Tax=Gemmatimonas sp. TaxID=1962908 RepID=UPI0022C93976|nr:molybdopterin dinucleotide binding domain-containing protein [Gemmatimonas sp.]MCZ8203527.1 hypothetical protein [Gemmatimonas sp.]
MSDDKKRLGGSVGGGRKLGVFSGFSPPLQVMGFIGTRKGDPDRGPMVRMRPDDALVRLVTAGDLVRVVSDRCSELAVLEIDESLPRGAVVLRDVVGASLADVIRVLRVDRPPRPRP